MNARTEDVMREIVEWVFTPFVAGVGSRSAQYAPAGIRGISSGESG